MGKRRVMRRSEEWWELLAEPTAVRCEGHVQDGSRCRREAILGANVCGQHGGAAPQVRQRAAARIGNAADEMVKRLHAMLDDPAVDARDKIKIATDMLDRAGLNATGKLLVGVGEVDPVEALFKTILNDPNGLAPAQVEPSQPSPQALAWNREAMEDDADIVEGEVVEDAHIPESMTTKPPPHIRRDIVVVEPERSTESMTTKPPPHIRRDLQRLGLL